jgi:hypothetical protein
LHALLSPLDPAREISRDEVMSIRPDASFARFPLSISPIRVSFLCRPADAPTRARALVAATSPTRP